MENTLKGVLTTLAMIVLFSTSMLSYIVLVPSEQGVTFTDAPGANAYTVIQNNTDIGNQAILTSLNNNSQNAFNQWDITVGFMGSNSIKQTSQTGVSGYASTIFSQLITIASLIFGSGSPIVYALTILATVAAGYLIYVIIQFVRQGQ